MNVTELMKSSMDDTIAHARATVVALTEARAAMHKADGDAFEAAMHNARDSMGEFSDAAERFFIEGKAQNP